MNFGVMIGFFEAKIDGFEAPLIVKKITDECSVISIRESNGSVFISTHFYDKGRIKRLCERESWSFELCREKGVYYKVIKYAKRYGIFAGILVCFLLLSMLSNIAFDVRVVGAKDPDKIKKIKAIAAQEGIKAGANISSLDFKAIENRIFDVSDDISWISIGNSGPVITINVMLSTHGVKSAEGRVPCNIIASHDGQIVYCDVLAGEFCSVIGNAVKKGDILVSGIVENPNGRAYYYHSIGKIIAEYQETVELKQPLYDRVETDGKTVCKKYLSFFDFDISLTPFTKPLKASRTETVTNPVKLFGIELPIDVKHVYFTEQNYKNKIYSSEEAKEILENKLNIYENDLIGSCEIISKNVSFDLIDDTMTVKAEYTLRGDIGIDSPIYPDK